MHRRSFNGRKFSREAGPREALLRNLASQVILHEKVTTTLEKAKEIRPIVEKLITRAKNGTLADRRIVAKFLSNNDLSLEKLFADLGPLYKERNGGYTRIVKLGNRKGDNAKIAQIQLLDTEKLTKKEIEKSKKEAPKAKESEAKEEKPAAKAEKPKKANPSSPKATKDKKEKK